MSSGSDDPPGWLAGGMPWQEVQASGPGVVQVMTAFAPGTLSYVNAPWQ